MNLYKQFKYFVFIVSLFLVNTINSQVLSTNAVVEQFASNNVFFDASTSYDPTLTFDNNNGKGLLFARTDLTSWSFDVSILDGVLLPTAYDGMIVYNIGTGNTPITGNNPTTATAVTPGFYYFSNPTVDPNNFSPTITAGVWTPLGGGSSSAVAIADGVASDSYATINATQEKVVRLTGISADGTNTTLDLDAALTTAGVAVAKFRKAAIYDTAGDLVMQATGGYTTGTDILVTGNGMMNKLLPAGSYSVEVYYTE
jgi:hypothetical protein